jgi:hypothetical protein
MQRIRLLYEQIEEAKRYLLAGSALSVRLALILLDNAAELIMNRELDDQFRWDEQCRLSKKATYTDEDRRKAERFFENKAGLLVRLGRISRDHQAVLLSCHRFRGEAFHAGRVRNDLLPPTTRLLFQTVCEMTVTLHVHGYMCPHQSAEHDDQRFLERFGLKGKDYALVDEQVLQHMRNVLTTDVPVREQELIELLSNDLLQRLENTISNLFYLGEPGDEEKVDYNLQHHQFWHSEGIPLAEKGARREELDAAFVEWRKQKKARFTLGTLKRWQQTAAYIGRQTNAAKALAHYSGVDAKFSPLEEDVANAVFQYEEEINMRINDARPAGGLSALVQVVE